MGEFGQQGEAFLNVCSSFECNSNSPVTAHARYNCACGKQLCVGAHAHKYAAIPG